MKSAMGIVGRDWQMVGLAEGWRRHTGVLHAELMALPLTMWVDPCMVTELATLAALADYRPASLVVDMGRWGSYVPVRLRLGRWREGQAMLEATGLYGELPRHQWWVPNYETLPTMPLLLKAS